MYARPNNSVGFCLTEMLVVITIISIVAATGIMVTGKATKEAALENSYASVVSAVESARTKAMQGVGDGSGTQSVSVSANGKELTTNTGSIELPPSVSITPVSTVIDFERISGKTGVDTTLTLTSTGGDTETVTITTDGYVY
jgi:prepilin-type N-terminal cleavage/methylation domain-containing protein